MGGGRGPCGSDDPGVLPVTPFAPWCCLPGGYFGAGGSHAGWVLSLPSTPIRVGCSRARPPGSLVLLVHEESEAAMAADEGMAGGTGAAGGGAAEGAEDSTQVVEYAAAIDVAKGSGMVYTRVPGSRGPGVPGSRADRRRQQTWAVAATFTAVTALMDRLRCEETAGSCMPRCLRTAQNTVTPPGVKNEMKCRRRFSLSRRIRNAVIACLGDPGTGPATGGASEHMGKLAFGERDCRLSR